MLAVPALFAVDLCFELVQGQIGFMLFPHAGAGACALPMAIRHHFPRAAIDAVDIDAEALDLAQCFFSTQEDAHLLLHPEDGVTFLTKHGVTSQVGATVASSSCLCLAARVT